MKLLNLRRCVLLMTMAVGAQSYAQLKVTDTGIVGVGTTNPNNSYNLTLGPNRLGMIHYNYGHAFRAGHSTTGAIVASSNDRIDFWYNSLVNYNVVKVQYVIDESDSSSKENIVPLRGGMDKLLQLKTYEYDFVDEVDQPDRKKSYGFLAQELNEVLPDLTDTSHGIMGIKTTQLIPFLVDGTQELYYETQEQSALIDSLIKKVAALENELYGGDPILDGSKLFQNEPNPFKENTVIRYELPADYSSAYIMLFNMSGAYIDQFEVSGIGEGALTIDGNTLEAGMYLYTLIVDDKELDTKRLILQQ